MDNEKKLNILIADDEEGLRFSLASILEMEGHDVKTAEDGVSALELVKNNEFDIAFFDIRMPGMNGVEAFKEIKKISPETIVVMMTAYAMNDLIKESIKEGAFACISKPFEIEDVLNTVKEISLKPSSVVMSSDNDTVSFLESNLKHSGYIVINENNPENAYSFIMRRTPEVLFVDFSKENADFIKKVKEIEGYNPEIVIMNAGADFVMEGVISIKKPLTKSVLSEIIKNSEKTKVAIISGDTIVSNNLKLSIVARGYDVSYFHTVETFCAFSDNRGFDFVVADMLGSAELETLTENVDKGKLIIITDFENPVSEILKQGNIPFIQRPFDVQELFDLMEKNKVQ